MPADDRTGFATTGDGCRLFFRSANGDAGAPAVVFSNSLGTTHAMWDAQAAELARDHRVVRYDSRGHGRSGVPAGPYAIDRLADDVIDLVDALGIDRFAFCGLSMGGMVGQSLGARYGDRLSHLVLANTSAYMGPPDTWDARIAAATAGGMAALRDGVLERWFTPEFRRDAPQAVAPIAAMLDTADVAGYVASCGAIRAMDQRERIAAIDVPVLVIVGSRDPSTPPEQGEYIAARIPGARLAVLEAAHLSNIERAAEFSAVLRAALSGGEAQRAG